MSDQKAQQDADKKAKAAAKAERKKQYEAQKSKTGEGEAGTSEKKSKAELKAERRLKQEAQRAAKNSGQKPKPTQSQPGDESTKGEKQTKQQQQSKQQQQQSKQQQQSLKKQTSSSSVAKSHDQPRVSSNMQVDSEKVQKRITKNLAKQNVPQRSATQKKVQMFSHLHQYEKDLSLTKNIRYCPHFIFYLFYYISRLSLCFRIFAVISLI